MKVITIHKGQDRLIPVGDESFELFNSMKIGDEISFEYKENKQRSLGNHKRLFSMLNGVVKDTDHYNDVNNLLDVIKLRSGYFTTVVSHTSEVLHIPKSISFTSMNEDEFKEFFSKAIDICLEFVPEQDIDSILQYC